MLQTDQIFLNVSKGQMASKEDLTKCFKTDDMHQILLEILKKGELQVGEKERNQQLSTMFKDIATIVSEKCINPETKRPYPVTVIEKLMSDLHFSIHPNKNSKQQALEFIKLLQEKQTVPIARAQMRIRITCKDGKKLKEKLTDYIKTIESEDYSDSYEMIALIDPGSFRGNAFFKIHLLAIGDILQTESKGRGQLDVLNVQENSMGDLIL